MTRSDDRVRRLRMRAQLLAGRRPPDVTTAVSAVLALQAQDTAATRLAVRVRTRGLVAADVDRACRSASVVRTWLMRGTLHMVAAADVRWLVGLLGPVFAAAGRPRRLQLGLDDRTCERALERIREILSGAEPLTRAELMRRLGLGLTGQAPAHLLGYAAHRGLICRGPDGPADEPTYVLLDEWVPESGAVSGDEALAALARRYLAAYGPATAEDFRAWSGLTITAARRGFTMAGSSAVQRPAGTARVARLLGAFDAYLLGYRTRDLMLEPRFGTRIRAGGGMIRPAVVVDGRVVGVWRQARTRDRLAVTVEPFTRLPPGSRDLLAAEAEDLGRFLGVATVFASAADAAG